MRYFLCPLFFGAALYLIVGLWMALPWNIFFFGVMSAIAFDFVIAAIISFFAIKGKFEDKFKSFSKCLLFAFLFFLGGFAFVYNVNKNVLADMFGASFEIYTLIAFGRSIWDEGKKDKKAKV